VDARAVSAIETFLQMVHDNQLATLVGEPTAGTNGDVNTFAVPGGFDVRFTGLRTSAPDGSTIQGHGIVPDQVVHPTLEGIRAGRDEILEAAIATAQRQAPP
jgi:C-terminal processing protease CtpA/Prc